MAQTQTGFSALDSETKTHEKAPTLLQPSENGTVALPAGIEVSSLEMSREGQNLVLTAPDGSVFVIEGYFNAAEAPDITSSGGSVLSPDLVSSFLTSSGDVRVAANTTASDKSPVGQVTETSGEATVTHADGTKEKITAGTEIYEGDIIETDAKGAVNIKFSDDSTFAVSENARLAVDEFSFNPDDQSGSTGLSILRGVFMFTSGLVGRENPDAVHLNTPVGSIGIRGTIIGGEISENGESQISVLEGAIVVRNDTGEQILSDQFETVKLTGRNAPITNIGTLDANTVSQNYGAVRAVSPALFSSIDDAAGDSQSSTGSDAAQPEGQQTQDSQQDKPGAEGPDATQDAAPDTPAGDAPAGDAPAGDAAQQPAAEAQPPAVDSTPVFQSLQTGSNLSSSALQAAATPAAPAPAPAPAPAAPPVAAAPAPQAPASNTPPATNTPTIDARPLPTVSFLNGGSVAEESATGTVVGTVGLTEARSYAVSYSIVTDPTNRFSVNPSTGVVTLRDSAGDYEQGITGYAGLVIRASKADGTHLDTTFNIGVTNVNEAPEFTLSPATINVDEGSAVVLTAAMVGATDPEGSTVTYTVSGTPLHGSVQVSDGTNWSTATTFTNADLVAGKVRFLQDGSEPGEATGFSLTAKDTGNNTSSATAFSVNVTGVNDAATAVTVSSTGTIIERDDTGSAQIVLGTITVTDSEDTADLLPSDFTILTSTDGGTTYAEDNRFEAVLDGTTWKLVAVADSEFNHEDAASLLVKVELTDAGTTISTTTPMTLTVTDVTEYATDFIINEGSQFATPNATSADAFIQGHAKGSLIAMLEADNPDADHYISASNYRITALTNGGAYVKEDFEIVEMNSDKILKLKDTVATDLANDNLTLTIQLDTNLDGDFNDAGDITKTITLYARNDTMVLETVNGHTGFYIENDHRFGSAAFGSSIAAGDYNGDGHIDLAFGAPNALNGDTTNPEHSGGVYALFNGTGFMADASDSEVSLSRLNTSANGFGKEVSTTGPNNDTDSNYGASIATLRRFDGTNGADLAVSDAGHNKIDIIRNGSTSTITTITNIATGAANAEELKDAIQIAGIGDINGDGKTDMLVGLQYANSGAGRSFIVFGTNDTTIDASNLSGSGKGMELLPYGIAALGAGSSVTGLHDFNGDGYADFAVGAGNTDTIITGGINEGSITVYYGNSTDSFVIKGATANGHIGSEIAAGGDINGDRRSELMYRDETNGGTVYVALGSSIANGDMPHSVTFANFKIYNSGSTTGITIGYEFGSAGDFNGDGYADIFTTITKDLGAGHYEHTLAIIYGNATPGNFDISTDLWDSAKSYKIRLLDTESDQIEVKSIGKFNADGYGDISISVPESAGNNGESYVVYGSNYDGTTKIAAANSTTTVEASNQSYVSGGASLLYTGAYTNIGYTGSSANDVMKISNTQAISRFDGGDGFDTIKLFFSTGETDGASTFGNIDARSQNWASKVKGVEVVEWSSGSFDDTLRLTLTDVLSMASSNGNQNLLFKVNESASTSKNHLAIYTDSSATSALNLLSAGFTNDADSNSTADTRTINSVEYKVYTYTATGVELLVDSRMAVSGTV